MDLLKKTIMMVEGLIRLRDFFYSHYEMQRVTQIDKMIKYYCKLLTREEGRA